MAGDGARRGDSDVQPWEEPVELENPWGLPLVLASRVDVEAAGE